MMMMMKKMIIGFISAVGPTDEIEEECNQRPRTAIGHSPLWGSGRLLLMVMLMFQSQNRFRPFEKLLASNKLSDAW